MHVKKGICFRGSAHKLGEILVLLFSHLMCLQLKCLIKEND